MRIHISTGRPRAYLLIATWLTHHAVGVAQAPPAASARAEGHTPTGAGGGATGARATVQAGAIPQDPATAATATAEDAGPAAACDCRCPEPTAPADPGAPIDLNQASAEALTALPQVGPARAQAIVTLRKRLGGFRRLRDLMRVRGIGRKTFRRLRPRLTLTRYRPPAEGADGSTPTHSEVPTP